MATRLDDLAPGSLARLRSQEDKITRMSIDDPQRKTAERLLRSIMQNAFAMRMHDTEDHGRKARFARLEAGDAPGR